MILFVVPPSIREISAKRLASAVRDLGSAALVDLRRYQRELGVWSHRNFGKKLKLKYDIMGFLGMVEEVGELAHSILKLSDGSHAGEDHRAKAKDAVGDIMICLLSFCERNGLDLTSIFVDTWAKVKKRDWKRDPIHGGRPGRPGTSQQR